MATVPDKPSITNRPDSLNGVLEFFWAPPASDGGSSVLGYVLSDGTTPLFLSGEPNYARVSSLTNGTLYSYSLAASNAIGVGPTAFFTPVQPGIEPNSPVISSITSTNQVDYIISWSNSTNLGSNTRLLGTVLTAYPLDNSGNRIETYSTLIFAQDNDSNASVVRSAQMLLSTANNYKVSIQCVNDPGYSPAVWTSTLQTMPSAYGPELLYVASNFGSGTWSNTGSLGATNSATAVNAPTLSSDSNGSYVVFNANSSQYFTIPTMTFNNFSTDKGMTTLIVAKYNNNVDYSRMLEFSVAGGNDNIAFGRDASNPEVVFQVYNGNSLLINATTSGNYLDTNYHIYGYQVVEGGGNAVVRVFRDTITNVFLSNTYSDFTDRVTTQNFIGATPYSGSSYTFDGNMREVRVYLSSLSDSVISEECSTLRGQYGIV